ncbi:glycosyltransferase family 39 protein [Candidatus Poribacteria bacterium]|nr:glycosyltransferase family 39 protein [Candidatus Poribacteria bacterium]
MILVPKQNALGRVANIRLSSLSVPLFLFVIALALRVVYIWQAERNDPGYSVLLPAEDMYQHDITAREFLKGNFGFSVRDSLQTSAFYPYFLAFAYSISGGSRHSVRLSQAVISSLSAVLLYLAALCFMPQAFAIASGLLMAFYGAYVFYSGLLLPETVIVFLYVLALLLLAKYKQSHTYALLIFAGITLALCVVARPNNVIVLPLLLLWVLAENDSLKRGTTDAGILLISAVVVMALWLSRGMLFGYGANPSASLGLYGFLVGNTYDSTGIFFHSRVSAKEMFAASEGSYIRGLLELAKAISDHPSQWLFAEARKFLAFWIGFEPNDNVSYHVSREFSALLRLPLPSFGFVSAMGLLGMCASMKDRRRFMLLYLMALGSFLSVFVFFVLSRYRLTIVPILILFSALAGQKIWGSISSRRHIRATALIVSAIVLLTLTRSRNINYLYPASYLAYYESMARHNTAIAFLTKGETALGEDQLKRLLAENPGFTQGYATYAVLCESQGRKAESLEIVEEGLKVAPSDSTLLAMRAQILSSAE